MSPRGYRVLVLLAAVGGFALRAWVWSDQGWPGAIQPGGDQDEYFRGAIHLLLRHDYYDTGQWLRPPLTSLWFATLFALGGVDIPFALLVQCGLGALTAPVVAAITRRLSGSHRAAAVAAVATALYLPFVNYSSQFLSETLFIFLVSVALLTLQIARERRMAWRWPLAGGVLWGLAALTRPVGLYAVPLLPIWILWELLWGVDASGQAPWRVRWRSVARPAARAAAAFLLGFVLVVAPWTARNYTVYHQLVVVDTNGGISFWLGNTITPGERDLQFFWNETLPNSALRQEAALARARANISARPLLFLTRTRDRAVSLWQPDLRLFAGNAVTGIGLDKRSLLFVAMGDAEYVLLLLAGLLGITLTTRRERNVAILGWIVYGTLISAVSLGHPRLRLPLLIPLFVYASYPLAHPAVALQRLRHSSWSQRAFLGTGAIAIVLVLFSRALVPFSASQFWLFTARIGGGDAAIERAVNADPGNFLPYVALGDRLRLRGDLARAALAYDAAATRAPTNTYAQARRYQVYRALGDTVRAREAVDAIRETGWETNQLYAWAWDALPAPATPRLDVAAPALGTLRGVYPARTDGAVAYRWTMSRADARLALPGARTLVLVVRADRPNTPLNVSYGGQTVASLVVGASWQRFQVALPASVQGDTLTLWAPALPASVDEPYPRGVALADAWLER